MVAIFKPKCVIQNSYVIKLNTCADRESFVGGGGGGWGPTLTTLFFKLNRRERIKNTTKSGPSAARQRIAISMAFRWRADNCPTLNGSLVAL